MNAQDIHILDSSLTGSVRSIAESERLKPCSSLKRSVLLGALCYFIAGSAIWVQPAEASTKEDLFRLYAHSRIIDYKQYKCLSSIIHKESRWNEKAVNGSHHGLGQMRSEWYRTLDPYRQIDATIAYIKKRYGSMCNAWRFHQKKGYY
jgi:hypothetical protein